MSRTVCTATGSTATSKRWVAAGLAGGLLALTGAVAAGWWPVSLDHRVTVALPGRHATGLTLVLLHLASALTTLATPEATVLITIGAAGLVAWRDRSRVVLKTVAVPLMVLTVSVLAGKALLRRPGPPGSHLHHLFGYYPSRHTEPALRLAKGETGQSSASTSLSMIFLLATPITSWPRPAISSTDALRFGPLSTVTRRRTGLNPYRAFITRKRLASLCSSILPIFSAAVRSETQACSGGRCSSTRRSLIQQRNRLVGCGTALADLALHSATTNYETKSTGRRILATPRPQRRTRPNDPDRVRRPWC